VTPTVFVVDDDEAVRQSVELLVRSVGLTVESYPSAQSFLESYDPTRCGCLLLDLRMPGMSGLELQRALKERGVTLPIIIVTGHGDVPVAVRAFKDGAIDLIEKPYSKQMLLERVRDAVERDVREREGRTRKLQIDARLRKLTPRENSVMERVVAGLSNKEIARDLNVSSKTVEVHRAHVMQKMEADSLADLVKQVMTARNGMEGGRA
jgi:two-component system response regulator FixJ